MTSRGSSANNGTDATRPDLDTLVGRWRSAFDAAQSALGSSGHTLPPDELRRRSERLKEERAATVRLLEALARDRNERQLLVRVAASRWDARRLLGVPRDAQACVFDLDGVLIGSAAAHAEAWRQTFDEFVARRTERTGGRFAPFSTQVDYPTHIHGRPRLDGVHAFLASRGISLPQGAPGDAPGTETVYGLANRKNLALLHLLDRRGLAAHQGARLYLELAHDAGLQCGLVSASANAQTMLERARLAELFDDRVDGTTMASEHLTAKPSADALLASCRHLGVAPERAALFETSRQGIDAGRTAGFELVVGVAQGDSADGLRAGGADLVVSDLGEIIELGLAA